VQGTVGRRMCVGVKPLIKWDTFQGALMHDDRVGEVAAVSPVDALPAIASPDGILGTRPIGLPAAVEPLRLADSRPFGVDLGHGRALAAAEPAPEQGKQRG